MCGHITSFNVYIFHVKTLTSRIKKNYEGFQIAGKLFLVFFISLYGEKLKNAPLFTTPPTTTLYTVLVQVRRWRREDLTNSGHPVSVFFCALFRV